MNRRTMMQLAIVLALLVSMPVAAKVSGLPDFTGLVEKQALRLSIFESHNLVPADSKVTGTTVEASRAAVKINRICLNFSDAISTHPITHEAGSQTAWVPVPGLSMLQMVTS